MEPQLQPQGFRGGVAEEDQGYNNGDPRPAVRQSKERVRARLKAQVSPFLLRPCPFCSASLLPDEKDYWCCGKGSRQHVLWPATPPELMQLMTQNRRRFADLSRVYNGLFCSAILHSGVGEPGLNYHVRGGPPCMRFSGNLYARMMRTEENCS